MVRGKSGAIYALYKGDEYIAQGTLKELVEKTKLKKTTLMFYGSPAYKKRNHKGNCKLLIKID